MYHQRQMMLEIASHSKEKLVPESVGQVIVQCNTIQVQVQVFRNTVTGSRVFSLTCPLGSLRPELMVTLFQPNPRSEG
ncbi:hypothetical protein TNCV_786391 [Trichonephila clavipes]|nr:hypothetical protein TNCV_786391 [Trichonephila clavipes]